MTRCTGTLRLVIACNELVGTCRYMWTMGRKQGLGALEGISPYLPCALLAGREGFQCVQWGDLGDFSDRRGHLQPLEHQKCPKDRHPDPDPLEAAL